MKIGLEFPSCQQRRKPPHWPIEKTSEEGAAGQERLDLLTLSTFVPRGKNALGREAHRELMPLADRAILRGNRGQRGGAAQRPIAVHALENLAMSDSGITRLRRLLCEQIKRLGDSLDPIKMSCATRAPTKEFRPTRGT